MDSLTNQRPADAAATTAPDQTANLAPILALYQKELEQGGSVVWGFEGARELTPTEVAMLNDKAAPAEVEHVGAPYRTYIEQLASETGIHPHILAAAIRCGLVAQAFQQPGRPVVFFCGLNEEI